MMKNALFLMMIIVCLGAWQTYALDVEGHITEDTNWEGEINVVGEITVDDGITLTISPGTYVEFQGHYKVNVQGCLLAVGTEQDTITFTAVDTSEGWHGIRFIYTPTTNDTSKIVHCKLEYGKAFGDWPDYHGGAIFIRHYDKVLVSHCTIKNNTAEYGGAILCDHSHINIQYNTITHNTATTGNGGGIYCYYSSPILHKNTISHNSSENFGGAIYFFYLSPILTCNILSNNRADVGGALYFDRASPTLLNNVICHNIADVAGGIYLHSTGQVFPTIPQLINNTVAYNVANIAGGIFCHGMRGPIMNTIFWANVAEDGSQIYINDNWAIVDFYYCDIMGGADAFGVGDGVTFDGDYENNIDVDPVFVDSLFYLQENSHCIDAGNPSEEYNDPEDLENPGNALWPALGTTINDMGAYGGSGYYLTSIEENNFVKIPEKTTLLQNYPNPFNPTTTIQFKVSQNGAHLQGGLHLTLNIYDISGKFIKTLVNEEKDPGYHSVMWDGKDEQGNSVASGVYVYRIEAESYSQNKKCIFLE